MNRDQLATDAAGAFVAAKAWLEGANGPQVPVEALTPDERELVEAFRYFQDSRSGGAPEVIPIAFGRAVFGAESRQKWWREEIPQPLPFVASAELEEKQVRENDGFKPVSDLDIKFGLSLGVLAVRDRYKKAS